MSTFARKRRANTDVVLGALLFAVAATLLPAAGIAIGTVGSELAHRAAAESAADKYPVGDPTRCHVRALDTAVARQRTASFADRADRPRNHLR
jgi:hypothetical protein